jgi:hypothetical protein
MVLHEFTNRSKRKWINVLNVDAWKTSDGGKSFKKINVGHGDTHDVWINPLNPENFIIRR